MGYDLARWRARSFFKIFSHWQIVADALTRLREGGWGGSGFGTKSGTYSPRSNPGSRCQAASRRLAFGSVERLFACWPRLLGRLGSTSSFGRLNNAELARVMASVDLELTVQTMVVPGAVWRLYTFKLVVGRMKMRFCKYAYLAIERRRSSFMPPSSSFVLDMFVYVVYFGLLACLFLENLNFSFS